MKTNFSDQIASSMNTLLQDPEYNKMFQTSSVVEKLAFSKMASAAEPIESPELEVEMTDELTIQPLNIQAGDVRADCVCCGKPRAGWTENVGVCKCATSGCSPLTGCKDDCACGCKTKAATRTQDMLVKSAFSALMQASADLEEIGFETLSAHALMLVDGLVSAAKKAKKTPEQIKEEKDKFKAKMEALRAKKDKSDARDKALKQKEKDQKDRNTARDKKLKDIEKSKADKLKSDKAKNSKK